MHPHRFCCSSLDPWARWAVLALTFICSFLVLPPGPEPHTSSLDEDGINLEEIREFAKNFKIRRLSLGLTQTQVGQALTATEGPAYSQSAICR